MNETFSHSTERARGSVACGRALFRDGLLADCHESMVEALGLQLQAWSGLEAAFVAESDVGASGQAATTERAFVALQRMSYPKIERLRSAAAAIVLPGAVTRARGDWAEYDWIWAEVERLTWFSARRALTPRALKLRRWARGVSAGLIGLLALFVSFRLWGRLRVQASTSYSEAYLAARAIDGLETTEWLLPDGVAGFLDVMLPCARKVHRVRLVNAHNPGFADRASKAVRVTAFSKSGAAVSVEAAFERLSEERSELALQLEADNTTRVRVNVLSHFKSGGGLAEVIIE